MDTILELSHAVRKRQVSPVELTRNCLARIEKLNPVLNAYILVTAEAALEQAQRAEQEIAHGTWRGPLHGIPIGLKDLIDIAGVPTTAASQKCKDRVAILNAHVVKKLDQAGVVVLGKQNLHEFAYGGSSMISYFGEVRNPWDASKIAGGSSGGSASAVAAGLGYGAIGTDTAGSIREPASLCGVVGLKPTYGLVSAKGVIPLSESLDHVGPITRSVVDAAVMLRAIAEQPLELPEGFEQAWRKCKLNLRVGVPRSYFYDDLDEDVSRAVAESLNVFRQLGCEEKEIRLTVDTDRTLQAVEAYKFHSKGVAKTPELYQAETVRRILTGANITSEQHASAYTDLRKSRQAMVKIFDEVDLIVTPTTPIPAPSVEELKKHPEQLRPHELVLLRNTRPFNVWAIPAISVPCGFTRSGLPVGLQIAAARGRDDVVLRAAYAYEQATEWHRRRPSV